MREIVAATNNAHKLREIRGILKEIFIVKSLKDCGIDIEIEENGQTFYDNALIKAKTIAELTNMPALADDSGLMVDALGGLPGVHSARYAGEPSNDKKNNAKLLAALKNSENRAAKFVSTIVLYFPDGKIISAEGYAEGVILHEERGAGGFGYDPLFLSKDLNKTFAEISQSEKNSVSHRSRALKNLTEKLRDIRIF